MKRRLICPPDNWKNPIVISEETAKVLNEVGSRLGLKISLDAASYKMYLGLPEAKNNLDKIKEVFGPLSALQESNMKLIWGATKEMPPAHRAYILATAWHESRLGKYMMELSSGTQYKAKKRHYLRLKMR